MLKCGIVGLPNVGKSTLFNGITKSTVARAENYPFCTIEPNTSIINVCDDRLQTIASISKSKQIIPAQIKLVDIAGLVKGASKGAGLGNQFLAHIREVDAIAYVLRCFDDKDISHVEENIDPIRDAEIIHDELMLADLESLERRIPRLQKQKNNSKESAKELQITERMLEILTSHKSSAQIRALMSKEFSNQEISKLQFLTTKPFLYICNVSVDDLSAGGNHYTKRVEELGKENNTVVLHVSARLEAEIAIMEDLEEQELFLETLGIKKNKGVNAIASAAYQLLDLITYFTVGPKEVHAWTIKNNTLAPDAAAVIHEDFKKGFIRAEVISYKDYINFNGLEKAKAAGKIRSEGKEYIMQDGDIAHFLFNV